MCYIYETRTGGYKKGHSEINKLLEIKNVNIILKSFIESLEGTLMKFLWQEKKNTKMENRRKVIRKLEDQPGRPTFY